MTMLQSAFEGKLSAKKVKELDNKLTYAIGYRNLYNIVVMAVGFVGGLFYTVQGNIPNLIFIVITILGSKWFITQMQENVDTLAVSEI